MSEWVLQLFDVCSLWTALSFHNIKLNALPLFQCAESVAENCGVVYENVIATLDLDKSVTFFGIEPFHSSLHDTASYQVQDVLALNFTHN